MNKLLGMNIKQWTILGVFALVDCLVVIAAIWISSTNTPQTIPPNELADSSTIATESGTQKTEEKQSEGDNGYLDTRPTGNGFFIWNNNTWETMVGHQDDSSLNIVSLPTTNMDKPIFAIQGDEYPIGLLQFKVYFAGFGIDVAYGENGAIINNVFENSPAQLAGIHPGDVILSVDGEKAIRKPMTIYTPGKDDIFGIMNDRVSIEVLSGTTSRTLEIPRTYLDTVGEFSSYFRNVKTEYSVEPMGDYVLLRVTTGLSDGVYRFEFPWRPQFTHEVFIIGPGINMPEPTPTFTPAPNPVPPIWPFVVRK